MQGLPKVFKYPLLSQEQVKLQTFKFGLYILMVHANKSPLKISEKREGGRIQGLYSESPPGPRMSRRRQTSF